MFVHGSRGAASGKAPGQGETMYGRTRRSAGTAWNARPALRAGLPKCGGSRTETPEQEGWRSGNPTPNRSWLGNRNFLARLRRTAASFDFALSICERGVPPFHTFPPVMRAANLRFAAISFFRLLGAPPPLLRQPEYGRGNAGLQTGTARRRRAKRVHLSIPQGALQRERLQETPTLTSLGEPQPTKPGGGSRRPGNVHPLR